MGPGLEFAKTAELIDRFAAVIVNSGIAVERQQPLRCRRGFRLM